MIQLRDARKLSSAICLSLAMLAAITVIVLAISWVGRREATAPADVGCNLPFAAPPSQPVLQG
jgi:hypothetical protein